MTTALLIIDVQQALCSGEYECFEIKRVIDNINDLSAGARDAGVRVILIQHEEAGSPLAHNAQGWQLAEGLETSPKDLRVRKTTADSFPLATSSLSSIPRMRCPKTCMLSHCA